MLTAILSVATVEEWRLSSAPIDVEPYLCHLQRGVSNAAILRGHFKSRKIDWRRIAEFKPLELQRGPEQKIWKTSAVKNHWLKSCEVKVSFSSSGASSSSLPSTNWLDLVIDNTHLELVLQTPCRFYGCCCCCCYCLELYIIFHPQSGRKKAWHY